MTTHAPSAMTSQERHNIAILMGIFSLRMMGLFLLLPVFSLAAHHYAGGDNPALVGLALGAFGLTQMLLHISMGSWSDRIGRKPVIFVGLTLFILGALIAASAQHIGGVIIGRILQGAGAISSVLVAFAADVTRESQRTKAMAMIGGSIGVSFALSLVFAPWLYRTVGLSGIFYLTAALALVGMLAVGMWTPTLPPSRQSRRNLRHLLRHPLLWRLNGAIALLHAAQMALFVVIPPLLVQRGIEVIDHWKIYLPVIVFSFVLVVPAIIAAERRGKAILVLRVATLLWIVSQLLFLHGAHPTSWLIGGLLLFFSAFNILEAQLPSILSRQVTADQRGAAMGLFSTAQSGGVFFGGAIGGLLVGHFDLPAVFLAIAACGVAALILCWGHSGISARATSAQKL